MCMCSLCCQAKHPKLNDVDKSVFAFSPCSSVRRLRFKSKVRAMKKLEKQAVALKHVLSPFLRGVAAKALAAALVVY